MHFPRLVLVAPALLIFTARHSTAGATIGAPGVTDPVPLWRSRDLVIAPPCGACYVSVAIRHTVRAVPAIT